MQWVFPPRPLPLRGLPPAAAPHAAAPQVLLCIEAGMDLCDSVYPHLATEAGAALCFPLAPGGPPAADAGEDGLKLNMRAEVHRTDKRPLLSGCACFTCARHTRAYVHHLLNTHEMLAGVLLDLHNMHHYQAFFAAARDAIGQGRFAAFAEFHRNLRVEMRQASAFAAVAEDAAAAE